MTRDRSSRQGNLRERIAHLAARIMAEDGIDDFGYAKRKAARQAGALDARAMPDNQEIERALAAYRELYQKDRHTILLNQLRRRALVVMHRFSHFNPHLVGAVLSGVAGKHSGIDLHFFTDSAKDFEHFLRIARASNSEARALLHAALDRQLVSNDDHARLTEMTECIGRMLWALERSLRV